MISRISCAVYMHYFWFRYLLFRITGNVFQVHQQKLPRFFQRLGKDKHHIRFSILILFRFNLRIVRHYYDYVYLFQNLRLQKSQRPCIIIKPSTCTCALVYHNCLIFIKLIWIHLQLWAAPQGSRPILAIVRVVLANRNRDLVARLI